MKRMWLLLGIFLFVWSGPWERSAAAEETPTARKLRRNRAKYGHKRYIKRRKRRRVRIARGTPQKANKRRKTRRSKRLLRRRLALILRKKIKKAKRLPLRLKPSASLLAQASKANTEISVIKKPPLRPRSDASDPEMALSEVYELVRKDNLDLKILRERMVQAELIRYKTWSILKPQISVAGIYTRNQVEAAFSSGSSFGPLLKLFDGFPIPAETKKQLEDLANAPPTVITPIDQLTFQLQMSWQFFNMRAIPLLQSAYLSVDQIAESLKQARREVMFAATRAYYSVLLTDGLVDIARQSLQNAEERLQIAKARYQAGVTPSLTVTRAELDVVSAQQQLIQSQTGLRNTKLALALLLNKRDMRFRPKRPQAPKELSGELTDWMSQAKRLREEVKTSRLAVQVAEKNVAEVWLRFIPTVALVTSLRVGNFQSFGTNQNSTWSVTLQASMNLYEGGARYAALKENESKLREARLNLSKSHRQVENEVSTALLSIKNSQASIQTAQQQVLLAEKSYALTQERFKTGVATPVEVSDANNTLNSARINLLRETLNLEVALLALRRAVGIFTFPSVKNK
ncbi:MAG: TolC family protein [Myxococcales bacterium]|nr:TolC family protein [Myxococcales bacterium]MCB9642080.1 TolC family protein [Myxococcales bacterium]